MRRIVASLLLMVGSILATAAKELPMTFAHDGATGNLMGAGQANNAQTDHLGSYVRLYTMEGDSVLIASYDPWGNRTTTRNTLKFHRGFTGHEHLTTYGVINMNGRMYDPTVGRFLAPDNFVQMPDFSQSFNRYSYCLNNPLKYTDPSGELFGIDDAFLIFALASSTISGMAHASMQGKNIWLGGLKGFASGALSVAGTAGIGQLLGHGIGTFGNEMLRGGLHGLNGGLSSVLDGGNFFSGFTSGAMSSLAGSGMQALRFGENSVLAASTALGSLTSGILHNDWLGGAIQGFQVGMLNHNGPKLKKLGPDYYENLEYLPEVEVRGVHFNTYGEKPLKSVPVEFGILFSGKLYYNIVKGLYSMANSGVHAAYQELRRWVNNASTMSPDKLRSDLEKAGWRRASDRSEHYKRGKHIIRLDGPDKNTPYNHMHINRVDKYHAFDKDLNRVDYRSRQAHIRIKP